MFILMFAFFVFQENRAYAVELIEEDVNEYDPRTDPIGDVPELNNIVGKILGIIQVIGIIVSVGALMIIGIRNMTASVEEKSIIKQALPGYIVGIALLATVSTIPNIVYKFANSVTSAPSSKVDTDIETITTTKKPTKTPTPTPTYLPGLHPTPSPTSSQKPISVPTSTPTPSKVKKTTSTPTPTSKYTPTPTTSPTPTPIPGINQMPTPTPTQTKTNGENWTKETKVTNDKELRKFITTETSKGAISTNYSIKDFIQEAKAGNSYPINDGTGSVSYFAIEYIKEIEGKTFLLKQIIDSGTKSQKAIYIYVKAE